MCEGRKSAPTELRNNARWSELGMLVSSSISSTGDSAGGVESHSSRERGVAASLSNKEGGLGLAKMDSLVLEAGVLIGRK